MNHVRREKIRAYLEQNHVATLGQLSALLPDVSLMTIHRDLNYLQEQGLVVKIRGGARYASDGQREPAFAAREIVNKAAKQEIAAKAVSLIKGSSSVFLDAGTTMMAFAKLIPDAPISIITSGPNIALELAKKQNPAVTVCGGTLNKNNLTLSGSAALELLGSLNIETAFLVASGYSAEAGFTCGNENEARIKALVLSKVRRSVMLMDSSKLERLLPYTFAHIPDIDYLVTDLAPTELPRELFEAAKAHKATIV